MSYMRILTVITVAALAGCSSQDGGSTSGGGKVYLMGSPAVAGPLTYTVLHSSWTDNMETVDGVATAKQHFLVMEVSITNGGPEDAGVPLLFLVDEKGKETMEEQKMSGAPSWLGLMRAIKPLETMSGKIIFDVPMANYKLKVISGGDPEKEVEALIDVPLRLEGPGMPGADAVPPAAGR
ncbi:MAG: DUF4352 domain-containing protein [Bryobacteraceae bacterium]|nr:DUF4352 domain-containing protein [Bryobacteraceae bacterium]